jgi:hypothetical protein
MHKFLSSKHGTSRLFNFAYLFTTHSHFALFHDKQCRVRTPIRKNPEVSNVENEGTGLWIPLLLLVSGNSLFRRAIRSTLTWHTVKTWQPMLSQDTSRFSDACPSASQMCKSALIGSDGRGCEPTQPPTQWVLGALSLGVKRPVHEADH